MRILDRLEDGDFYLQAIAVDESARGQGIDSILLNLVEERAGAAGCSRICLDVSAGNVGARRLYERWGMTVVET
jgi:ribosomal protein S18 acetylase RimI-like enzyme